jgi:hypothetical protein
MAVPSRMLRAANKVVVPLRMSSCVIVPARARASSASRVGFGPRLGSGSSHQPRARQHAPAGRRKAHTTSRSLAAKCGSRLSLKVCSRCSARPCAPDLLHLADRHAHRIGHSLDWSSAWSHWEIAERAPNQARDDMIGDWRLCPVCGSCRATARRPRLWRADHSGHGRRLRHDRDDV